jgi:two-component system, NarL family, sensor histidine kinase UhpB
VASQPGPRPAISLFWRLFIPNACVLVAACVVLIVEPANGRAVALIGGLLVMLTANLLLMRRAFGPLARLTALMNRLDPLEPGQRVPAAGPSSEVTVLADAFNAMLDRIEQERRDSARRLAGEREAERRHVAAELHDDVGQTLTALQLQLDRLSRRSEAPREELREARETAEAALDDVRRLARSLRPEALDQLGLVPALSSLCTRLSQRTGLPIRREFPTAAPDLSGDAELVVYRVAQEALTNVVRHARAGEARVVLRPGDGRVELLVEDDGMGIGGAAATSRGGIRGMRERALLVGGRLTLVARPEGGTRVRLEVPVRQAEP